MSKQVTRIANSLDFHNLSHKTSSRGNPKKVDKVATLWRVQSVMDAKDTVI